MNGRHSAHGWTLIELLVSLALLALLTALALPSFQTLIQTQSADRLRDDLFAHLTLARTQAQTLGLPVAICASSNLFTDSAADLQCSSDGEGWSIGWIVFVDVNEDRQHQSDETILWVYEDGPGTIHVDFTWPYALRFDRQGRTLGTAGSFVFCGLDFEYEARFAVAKTGRIRVAKPEDDSCI